MQRQFEHELAEIKEAILTMAGLAEKTLDDETVDIVHEKIVNTLMSRFGGRYRDGQE